MGIQSRKLPKTTATRIMKLPCDGVRRYKVKGLGGGKSVTYAAAYDGILISTGGHFENQTPVFSGEGIRRVTKLNESHLSAIAAGNHVLSERLKLMGIDPDAGIAQFPEDAAAEAPPAAVETKDAAVEPPPKADEDPPQQAMD